MLVALFRCSPPVMGTNAKRELESLFDRYDEDCSNTIDYKALCDHLFEMGEHIAMNSTSRSMIDRVRKTNNVACRALRLPTAHSECCYVRTFIIYTTKHLNHASPLTCFEARVGGTDEWRRSRNECSDSNTTQGTSTSSVSAW